jgi:hypothetical protein
MMERVWSTLGLLCLLILNRSLCIASSTAVVGGSKSHFKWCSNWKSIQFSSKFFLTFNSTVVFFELNFGRGAAVSISFVISWSTCVYWKHWMAESTCSILHKWWHFIKKMNLACYSSFHLRAWTCYFDSCNERGAIKGIKFIVN